MASRANPESGCASDIDTKNATTRPTAQKSSFSIQTPNVPRLPPAESPTIRRASSLPPQMVSTLAPPNSAVATTMGMSAQPQAEGVVTMKPSPPNAARTPEKKPRAFTGREANHRVVLCQSARPGVSYDARVRRISRLLTIALALAPMLGACRSSSSPGGTAAAEIRWHDGGTADLVVGDRVLAIPAGELADGARPSITQDTDAKRFAYVTLAGDSRLVYAVGGGLWVGPRVKSPADFATAPDLDHALGSLFENAGDRREALVSDVKKAKGDPGVARLLVDAAHVDAREWDETYVKLPEANAAAVRFALGALLEKGKSTSGLRRAVLLVPLREAAQAPVLAARVRELADSNREPRASAVMLRALAASDKALASAVGCDVLGHAPLDTVNAKGTPEEIDGPGREALAEAAALAIATGAGECKHVAALLGTDLCLPSFRCGASGPLDGRETTKQDEPLCTKEQLSGLVTKELERSPSDVLGSGSSARPALFAFAALTLAGKVPAPLVTAHTRRRYTLVQPTEPSCETGGPPGSPCHCDEATVRDQTCRHPESKTVSVGICKFDVNDKQKKILDVVVAIPP